MKRFTIALAVVLALGFGSTALAKGHHGHGQHGKQHISKKHHGFHGHRGPVVVHRPPVIRVHRPPVIRVYSPPVVYYPPVYPYGYAYGYRSPEAELAIGIGQIVGAAIDMGR